MDIKKALKRALVALAVLAAIGPVAAGVLAPRLFGDRTDYSRVVSIEKSPEYQDAARLARAWALPVAAKYREDGVEEQKNGSFCGPTSAVEVARSLGVAVDQRNILEGTGVRTLFGAIPGGLTLDELADLLEKKSSRKVTVLRDLDLAAFRAEVAHANDLDRRYVVNFHRGPLFGAGVGHHSPIAGYLADEDLVLVLDVNAKYHPWLVKTERLFQAIDTVDRQSGRKRGLLRVE